MIKNSVPYLVYNDNCNEALMYYVEVFKAEIVEKMTFEDMGFIEDENRKSCIGHSVIKLGDSLLYAGDVTEKKDSKKLSDSSQISLWLEIDSTDKLSELVTKLLNTGSISIEELHETFWESKYAKVKDKFGIIWELNAQL